MNNLCIIPVRGGSKGLPHKNMLPIVGDASLLEWTIRQALASRLKDSVLVSTEDAELAAIASSCGLEVAIRPDELAQDETTTAAVVEHLLKEHDPEGTKFDAITILQVTSPLRQASDIDAAVEMFESGDYDSVVSGCAYEGIHPAKLYYHSDDGMQSVSPDYEICRRQDLPEVAHRNGAIFMVSRQYFDDIGCLWGGRTGMLKMPVERSIDIDTQADLDKAREYLKSEVST